MTAAFPGFRSLFAIAHRRARPREMPRGADRARRAFVDEMLSRNPDAFASEYDVQCMLHMYPGRF